MNMVKLVGLPDSEDGVAYIVTHLVASHVKRSDVFSTGAVYRNRDGFPIGCKSLVSHA